MSQGQKNLEKFHTPVPFSLATLFFHRSPFFIAGTEQSVKENSMKNREIVCRVSRYGEYLTENPCRTFLYIFDAILNRIKHGGNRVLRIPIR